MNTEAVNPEPLPLAHKASGDGPLSVTDAVRSVGDWRNKQLAAERQIEEPQAGAETATPQESEAAPAVEDATPPLEATGETAETDPAEVPPLERPRSWSKEKESVWTKLDRDTQQYLLDHDSEVSKGVRKAQNEAAEARKATEADRAQAEQARKSYEGALPGLLEAVQQAQAGEFGDIRSIDDVQKLAAEDPLRYLRWQANQQKIGAIQHELKQSQDRQAQEKQHKWNEFSTKADADLISRMPELADKAKQTEIAERVMKMIEGAGLPPNEFVKAWTGQGEVSIRHPAIQELLAKAALYEIGKEKAAKAVARPLPPVQKPGVGKSPNAGIHQQVQDLQKQLQTATGLKALNLGTKLAGLQRQMAAR